MEPEETAVARHRPYSHVSTTTDTHATVEGNAESVVFCALLERLYSEDHRVESL
jgi:hypothetical protein